MPTLWNCMYLTVDFHSSWNSIVIYIVTIIRLADEHSMIQNIRQTYDDNPNRNCDFTECLISHGSRSFYRIQLAFFVSFTLYLSQAHFYSYSCTPSQCIIQFGNLKVDFPSSMYLHSATLLSYTRARFNNNKIKCTHESCWCFWTVYSTLNYG